RWSFVAGSPRPDHRIPPADGHRPRPHLRPELTHRPGGHSPPGPRPRRPCPTTCAGLSGTPSSSAASTRSGQGVVFAGKWCGPLSDIGLVQDVDEYCDLGACAGVLARRSRSPSCGDYRALQVTEHEEVADEG